MERNRRRITHLSLFSGIGGLDLAAEWAGIETIGQCEWADYPTKVLEKHWPDIPRWKDIRTLTGESFYERTGLRTVDVISGGFPCQPFSVAGKQRGKEDDRYLWPEMVRVIKELRPAWIVGENVAGIIRMALPDILSELEACGYRTRAFFVPACAVGARHRRYRVAIVGYAEHDGSSSTKIAGSPGEAGMGKQKREKTSGKFEGAGELGNSQKMGKGRGWAADKTVADTDQKWKLQPARSKQDVRTRAFNGGKNVPHSHSAGWEELHSSQKPDQQRVPCRRCDERTICNASGARLPDRAKGKVEKPEKEQELERPDSNVPNADNGSRDVRGNRGIPEAEVAGGTGSDFGKREEEYEPGGWRVPKSLLGRVADGISDGMDRDFLIYRYWDEEPGIPRIETGIKHRADRIKCLGNAVVPQQFYPIFQAIAKIEEKKDDENS